jgi:Na+-driven multidrug efflux pump
VCLFAWCCFFFGGGGLFFLLFLFSLFIPDLFINLESIIKLVKRASIYNVVLYLNDIF